MRLTFVMPNLRLYGGVKSTVQMAEALHQLGHEVVVVYPRLPSRDGQPWWRPRKTLVQIVRFIQSFMVKPNWFSFSGSILLVPYNAERFLPDADILVLTWWSDVEALQNVDAAKGRVLHFARSYETWGGPPDRVEAVYQLDLPRVVNSEALGRQMPINPLAVITNGIDDVFFTSGSAPKPSDQITIGVLYRVQDWKRMDDALDAISNLMKQNVNLKLVLFGEPIEQRHKAIIDSYSDTQHYYLPAGDALRDVYAQLDIFVFTSDETEAFGNPPLEAMASGCAVVATRVGAIPDYSVHGQSALHCAPRDVATLTRLVQRLIDDERLRASLGQRAKEAAAQHRWASQAKVFERLLIAMSSNLE